MCPTGDKYKYIYKLSTTYEEIYIVCVLREISISMCPTGDKYKYVSYRRSE